MQSKRHPSVSYSKSWKPKLKMNTTREKKIPKSSNNKDDDWVFTRNNRSQHKMQRKFLNAKRIKRSNKINWKFSTFSENVHQKYVLFIKMRKVNMEMEAAD